MAPETPETKIDETKEWWTNAMSNPELINGVDPTQLKPSLAPYITAAGDYSAQQQAAEKALAYIESMQCNTPEQAEQLNTVMRQCKTMAKSYDDRRKLITQPLNQAKREVDSWLMPIVKVYERAERTLKRKLVDFNTEQTRKKHEAIEAMKVAQSQGNQAGVVIAATSLQQPPELEGTTIKKVWQFRVTDVSKVPPQFLQVNETALRAYMRDSVKANGTPQPIPGVAFYQDEQIATKVIK